MNTLSTATPLDAHEKTIDLRIARLRDTATTARHLHADPNTRPSAARRALVVLLENRALVAAHAQTLTAQIIDSVPADEQDALLLEHVRPLTLTVEDANTAIARLRATLGEHG